MRKFASFYRQLTGGRAAVRMRTPQTRDYLLTPGRAMRSKCPATRTLETDHGYEEDRGSGRHEEEGRCEAGLEDHRQEDARGEGREERAQGQAGRRWPVCAHEGALRHQGQARREDRRL